MKKVSLFLITLMLFTVGTASANTVPEPKELSAQIESLLERNQLVIDQEEEVLASVLFTLNENQEIVVLSVQTENRTVEAFVKSRLNYKKVTLEGILYQEGENYRVPVRITA